MQKQLAYLLGLILGRGHINYAQKKIIIEFAHKNVTLNGIVHCEKCGGLATVKKQNNPQKLLYCKICGHQVNSSKKTTYYQRQETLDSLKNGIIPFLKLLGNLKFLIRGNDHITFLIIDFSFADQLLSKIKDYFNNETSFDAYHIPLQLNSETPENKTEFINGVLDSASFPAAGGWLNRDGKNGVGRMRSYFQIVRNWSLPVELCNFLKDMKLPIHTIDWGHPNIRDSAMEDYYNSNPTSWGREHQLKFFPEYYKGFTLRLSHKNALMQELINHNEKVDFERSEDCEAPSPIDDIKAIHHGENDPRIPLKTRCHANAYWQVCHNMGCKYTTAKINISKNKDAYFLTGKDLAIDIKKTSDDMLLKSLSLTKSIDQKYKIALKTKPASKTAIRTNPEQKLYEPIRSWLEDHYKQKKENVFVCDTSSSYLINFIMKNDLFDEFEFCENFKIRPDIVGFNKDHKSLHFIEVKITELTLKDIGQLLGYCLVANPGTAILVSPQAPSITLIKILEQHPDQRLTNGSNKSIKIGQWDQNNIKIIYP